MTWYMIILVFIVLLGVFTLSWQMFCLVRLDAQSRGLKYPKFWGLFALGGNNGSSGLLLYLIGRRKYPSTMNEEQRTSMNQHKKKALVSLCFVAAGTIGLVTTCLFIL